MRKLVHLAFGILKSQKPFDPNYLTATPWQVKTVSTELYHFPIPTDYLPIIFPNTSGKFKGEFNCNRV
jgi:hypothetical protein